jgi:hypothetical protein
MVTNNPTTEQPTDYDLGELMSETERAAVRTLLEESVQSPAIARGTPIDSIFSALSDPGRRYILTYLFRSDGYVTLSELIDYVMQQTDQASSDEEFRRRVAVTLTHEHLPALDEEGFLIYNMERQLIQPTDKTPLVAPYLKLSLSQQARLDETLHG